MIISHLFFAPKPQLDLVRSCRSRHEPRVMGHALGLGFAMGSPFGWQKLKCGMTCHTKLGMVWPSQPCR